MHLHKCTRTDSQASNAIIVKKKKETYIERTGIADHAQWCTKEETNGNVSNNKFDILQKYVF